MQEWHEAIGQLVLSFGDIEHSLYLILSECGENDIYTEYKDEDFVCRARKCIEIIKGIAPKPSEADELIALLKQSMGLIGVRNLIAHNPLHPIVTSDSAVRLSVISTKDSNKKIDLADLQKTAFESANIKEKMYQATHAVSCKIT